ncbi:unnamed protein product [Phaeothamnion confervicola]
MLHSNDPNFLSSVWDGALPHLLATLRNPSRNEGVGAARAVAVLCTLLGPDHHDAFDEVAPALRRLITRCEHAAVRVAAARALGLSCFVCCAGGGDDDGGSGGGGADVSATDATLTLLRHVFRRDSDGLPVPDELCAAALEGWGLIVSAAAPGSVARVARRRQLPALVECLRCPRSTVRVAAGENLALLHECKLAAAEDGYGDGYGDGDGDDDWGGEGIGGDVETDGGEGEAAAAPNGETGGGGGGGDDGDSDGGSSAADAEEIDENELWEEVTRAVKALAGETSKRMSRESRKQQRRTFREICATIVDDEPPEETISLLNGSLDVSGWAQVKQVAAVRQCLQGGFQLQLQWNRPLRTVLGVGSGGTGGAKVFRSKSNGASKSRTTERTRSRASRQSAKDHFLYADDGS